jgi:hypothetical protein
VVFHAGALGSFFLVDLVGMVLLVVGVLVLRRDAVPRRLGMLIAGYAWTAANFWRAIFGRVSEVSAGGVLDYGALELCLTACILAAALTGLGWALVLSARAVDARQNSLRANLSADR